MDPWRIELLGQLRATRGGTVVSRFRSEKTAALLGWLAHGLGAAHPRELLVDAFWPDCEPEAGRNNLSKSLSALRAQLEPPGTPAGAVIAATRAHVQLDPDAVVTDVGELEAALAEAASAEGEARWDALERACALYRGDLLPGCFHDWTRGPREQLRAAFLGAGLELVAGLRARGETQRGIERALALLAVDPLAQEASRELMSLFAQAGEPIAALRHYEELEARLQDELGVTPAPELVQLARSLERSLSEAARRVRASGSGSSESARLRAAAAPAPPPLTGSLALLLVAGEELAGALPAAQARGGRCARLGEEQALFAFAAPAPALGCAGALRARPGAPPPRQALDVGAPDDEAALARLRGLVSAAHPGQLLGTEPVAALLRRDEDLAASVLDLGLYRLAPGAPPTRLFQLDEGAPPRFPELQAECLTSKPWQVELTRFWGREEELRRARQALEGGARLVTLTGPGGIGKTRLALELARLLTPAFQGAVWFAPLAALTSPASLPRAIADALGLPGGDEDPLALVADFLAARPALLLLDNLEHLLEGGVELLQQLLARAPRLACLVTSRSLLGLEGEQELPLPPFAVPGAARDPAALSGFASVRLLVERAQLVAPGFELTARNAPDVAELVRRLEGIPLALTLAAGRLQALPPGELVRRLGSSLDLPPSRSRGLPARHRSVRAALEGSYRLLAPEQQRFFARLARFRGGFTVEAAEAVCEEPLALDRLCELREVSLVQAEGDPRPGRFTLLETVREFAREQLAPAQLAQLGRRHAEYYAELVRRAHAEMEGPAQASWLQRLDAELENLRAAFAEEQVDPAWARARLVIAGGLSRFWETRLRFREGQALTTRALAGAPEPTAERAEALLTAGHLAVRQGDRAAVRALVEESAAIARQLGGGRSLSRALCILGTNALDGGDWAEAQARFEEFLQAARAAGEEKHTAIALLNLAMVRSNQGDYAEALAAGEEAHALLLAQGNDAARAYLEVMLGDAHRMQGRHERAAELIEGSLAALGPLKSSFGACIALASLGDVRFGQGRLDEAEALYREALERSRAGEDPRTRTNLLTGLADVAHLRGDLRSERRLLEEARAVADDAGSGFVLAYLDGDLARLAHAEGDLAAARAHTAGCLGGLRRLGAKGTLLRYLEGCAALTRSEGDLPRAARLWGAIQAYRRRLGTPSGPHDEARAAAEQDALRAGLGEDAFRRAWESGQALGWEATVACALGEEVSGPGGAASPPRAP